MKRIIYMLLGFGIGIFGTALIIKNCMVIKIDGIIFLVLTFISVVLLFIDDYKNK